MSNQTEKKAVFFDIDGTIWDREMYIPDSTREAIRKLRENGHYTFICSGRTKSFITNEELLQLGFDGIVAGCGTYIEFEKEVLLYETLPREQAIKTLEILRSHNIEPVLEGRHHLYLDVDRYEDGDASYLRKMQAELGERLLSLTDYFGEWEISKLSAALTELSDADGAGRELEQWYEVMKHEDFAIEFSPKGFTKASGMQFVCDKLGIKQENTYAIGDSVNDLDMLRFAAHGIAMGDGMEMAKEAADYVTTSLKEDGVYNGMKHFGLI